ncbi:MAG: citramalate synthase [Phycisphaeraceae bacterium]|nr:citramalate synthase [Phycisphaeraceae bacterium]
MTTKQRVELYDTTLRDGTQGLGITLTLVDKINIARLLDDLGFDYIEGGYPLSNPKDVAFFEEARKVEWKHAKICAFGMTRRKDIKPEDDVGMNALVSAGAPIITIVGKTWDLHVDEVLRVDREENLAMIEDSVRYCSEQPQVEEVFYDAEHFFDGYKANSGYALQTLDRAVKGGATRLVLCDTNGGSLPSEVAEIVTVVRKHVGAGGPSLAIHVHNDGGLAVANSLAAVQAGCVQVQGTINGIGERCGNVDLITMAANLSLKYGKDILRPGAVGRLTELSRFVYEATGTTPVPNQPYVSDGAFAHKGGMHVHAVRRIAHSYEHVPPESIGNQRHILVSELSGASNIAADLGEKFAIADNKDVQRKVLERVQDLEHEGYQFEQAKASYELLVYEALGKRTTFWDLDHYRCTISRHSDNPAGTEATVKLMVNGKVEHRVAEGDGPVNALDGALRACLRRHFPQIDNLHLADYHVRVVNPTAESAARVRATIEFAIGLNNPDQETRYFTTVGVDTNVVDASWRAIADAIQYHLIESSAGVTA